MIKETIDIFKILADTPLPTILVIAGLIALFLAVVGKIEGHINLTTARQKLTGFIGTLFLILGIMLFILQGIKPNSVKQEVPHPQFLLLLYLPQYQLQRLFQNQQ